MALALTDLRFQSRESLHAMSPSLMTRRLHTSLIGAEPPELPARSARARWEAGDDLDFHDSDSEEGSVENIEAAAMSMSQSRWSSTSSSAFPAESTETASIQELTLDAEFAESQELEIVSSAGSDYSGADEVFDISPHTTPFAASSKVLASQRYSKERTPVIYISPAFPLSPIPESRQPQPQQQQQQKQQKQSPAPSPPLASPSWSRARSKTELPPKSRTLLWSPPPRLRTKQVHFAETASAPPTRLTHNSYPAPQHSISRPLQARTSPGFEPRYHRKTTSYSFI